MRKITGLPGAKGQTIGNILRMKPDSIVVKKEVVDIEGEIHKFRMAQQTYGNELDKLYEETLITLGEDAAAILKAYKMILFDEEFFKKALKRVQDERISIDYAISEEQKAVSKMFQMINDPYMRERGADIENVCKELIAYINGKDPATDQIIYDRDFIVVAEDLSPADTIRIDKKYLRGMITERGGITSHTVILAKTLGIPAVVGATGIMEATENASKIFLNGGEGYAYLDPEDSFIKEYGVIKKRQEKEMELYDKAAIKQAITLDGIPISVCTNSGDMESIEGFREDICDGVGLFRTEFLYMSEKDYPTEEKQYEIYKQMALKTNGKELIIRTLDIGGDKQLDYMNLPSESNPFLGYRAIRICLDRKEIFLTQLRAILRASNYGHVKIMFPMIVTVEELRMAKQMVKTAMTQLEERNIPYNKEIETGIMIETPASVLISDKLAKEADFFSIGTNDLIQYTTATDRMNDKVQYLYDVCNLSVLKAVYQVIQNGHKAGIKVGMCGEAASDERLTPVWLGFGLDEFSMVPGQIGRIKYILGKLSKKEAEKLVAKVLELDTIHEVKEVLNQNIKEIS